MKICYAITSDDHGVDGASITEHLQNLLRLLLPLFSVISVHGEVLSVVLG